MYRVQHLYPHYFLSILLLFVCLPITRGQELLEKKLDMKVYASERLESVLFRLEAKLGIRVGFEVVDLLPYKAIPANYQKVSVDQILEEQLAATLLTYQINNKGRLLIKKKNRPLDER